MYVKDLKENTYYATTRGTCVRVLGPIHGQWAWIVEDGERKIVDLRERKKENPWAPNPTRVQVRGVKVQLHEVDKDGKVVGGGNVTVMRASEIAGTWEHYLRFNAKKLREQKEEEELTARLEELEVELHAAAKRMGVDSDWVRAYTNRTRYWEGKNLKTKLRASVTFSVEAVDIAELEEFLSHLRRKRAR